jgi:hypothetical protein
LAFTAGTQPSAAGYTPDASVSYNSMGGANTIARNGTGNYTVTFSGMAQPGGNPQVTTGTQAGSGAVASRCKSSGWTVTGGNTAVNVLCFDAHGAPLDSVFYLLYVNNEAAGDISAATKGGAYEFADMPEKTSPYIPGAGLTFSSFGTGKPSSVKTGTGTYSTAIPGSPSFATSTALVTAVGTDSSYCNIASWLPLAVNCYAQGGTPVDSKYSVLFQTSTTLDGP